MTDEKPDALAEVREAATDAQAARASLILWNIDPPERALAHNVTLLNAIEAIVSAAERAVEAAMEQGVASVLRIRCMPHRAVVPYNNSEAGGGECAACAVVHARCTAFEEAAIIAEGDEGSPTDGKRGYDLRTGKWQPSEYWHGRGVAADEIREMGRKSE
jgi:hypothetical protein